MKPTSFFNFGIEDNRPHVLVRSRRNMICRPLDGSPRPVAIGEEITVSAEILDQLEAGDIEVLGPVPDALEYEI